MYSSNLLLVTARCISKAFYLLFKIAPRELPSHFVLKIKSRFQSVEWTMYCDMSPVVTHNARHVNNNTDPIFATSVRNHCGKLLTVPLMASTCKINDDDRLIVHIWLAARLHLATRLHGCMTARLYLCTVQVIDSPLVPEDSSTHGPSWH